MRINVFQSFFARIFAAFLLVTVIVTLGVYVFFEQRAVTFFHDLLEEESRRFDNVTRGLHWENETHKPKLTEVLQELVNRRQLIQLVITSTDGEEIFSFQQSGTERKPLPWTELNAPLEEGEMKYDLIREDSRYVLPFSVYHPVRKDKAVIVSGVLPLEDNFAGLIETVTMVAVSVVMITAALIALAVFPLIYHGYKKSEQDRKQLQHSYLAMFETLGRAIAKRDNQTNKHNLRVTYYAMRLGEQIGLETESIRTLLLGAFLHDLGKIATPDTILLKPGGLDAGERKIMEAHVLHGLEIIADIEWLARAKAVIASHHEHFDGSGYPVGLQGTNIPVEARIFAVVDVFDALTSERPYKSIISVENALAQLKEDSNAHFDAKIVKVFVPIAKDLYTEIVDLSEQRLQNLLQQAASRHFPELKTM